MAMWLDCAELWVVVRRSHDGSRRVRDYAVHRPDGLVLLTGQASNWGRDLRMQDPHGAGGVLLRRRRLFPLTGRIDVLRHPDHHLLGRFHRSGRIHGADGANLGRLRDARSLRSRAGEGLLAGALEAALGGDGNSSQLSGPSGFIWVLDGVPIGTLVRTQLPFDARDATPPSALTALGSRILPPGVRDVMARVTTPHGWRMQREAQARAFDPWLVIGGAVMAVEMAQW